MRIKVYGEIQTSGDYRWVWDGNITVHMTKGANVSGTGWWEVEIESVEVSSSGTVTMRGENVFPDEQPTHSGHGVELPIVEWQID